MIHLTNDAVQKKSEDYGRFESGNKVSSLMLKFLEFLSSLCLFFHNDDHVHKASPMSLLHYCHFDRKRWVCVFSFHCGDFWPLCIAFVRRIPEVPRYEQPQVRHSKIGGTHYETPRLRHYQSCLSKDGRATPPLHLRNFRLRLYDRRGL